MKKAPGVRLEEVVGATPSAAGITLALVMTGSGGVGGASPLKCKEKRGLMGGEIPSPNGRGEAARLRRSRGRSRRNPGRNTTALIPLSYSL